VILYRPVGLRELELIAETGFREFPLRLAHQRIFYPVLSFEYAEQIARDWNTKDPASSYCGFVRRFEIADSYARQSKVHTVGASLHRELWVPAEQLREFNEGLLKSISVASSYYGGHFSPEIDEETGLPAHVAERYRSRREGRCG